jgi:hypothetical protein
MKVNIVTEADKVVGYQPVADQSVGPGQFRAALIAGPGQQVREVEVPEEFALIANPEDIQKRLATHLPKR